MRAMVLWTAIALALSAAEAAAQNRSGPVYPLPPPPPVVMTTPGDQGGRVQIDVFSDRMTRCLHYGASIGVPADQMDAYVKRCFRQP